MAIYAVIAPGDEPKLTAAVEREFAGRFFMAAPGQYMVSAENMTTTQISEKIGAQDGTIGRVMVLRVNNYTGWHAKDLWEWLNAQAASPSSPSAASAG